MEHSPQPVAKGSYCRLGYSKRNRQTLGLKLIAAPSPQYTSNRWAKLCEWWEIEGNHSKWNLLNKVQVQKIEDRFKVKNGNMSCWSRCVCRGRLELINNLVFDWVWFILFHLWQQFQCLFLFLCWVVSQEVSSCCQDGCSSSSCHQVKADCKGHVDTRTMIFLVLLLKCQDQLWCPVTKPYHCSALENWNKKKAGEWSRIYGRVQPLEFSHC